MKLKNMTQLLLSTLTGVILAGCNSGTTSQTSPTPATTQSQKITAYAKDGKLYKYEMYLGNSKKVVYAVEYARGSLPNGILKYNYKSLAEFLKDRPKLDKRFKEVVTSSVVSQSLQASLSSNGIAVGYIPSIDAVFSGSGNNSCYITNPAVSTSSVQASSDFSVTDSTSSNQSMMSNSTSVAAGIGAFSASNTTSFSNSYQSTAANGSYVLGSAVSAIVNTGVPSTNNLTANGLNLYNTSPVQFLQTCGSSAIASYVGGILTTLNLQVSATSESASQAFSNSASVGWNSNSISNAFSNSSSSSGAFNGVSMTYTTYGDVDFINSENNAQDYSTYVANALAANQSYYEQCAASTPNLAACSTFNSNMSAAIMQATTYAQGALANGNGAQMLYAFPDGIFLPEGSGYNNPQVSGGGSISYVNANESSLVSITDPFVAQSPNLIKALQLSYQINTLAARASLLASLPGLYTPEENNSLMNLANFYYQDSKNIISAASSCYNSIMSSYASNPTECSNATINYVNDTLSTTLDSLPSNVYQLYYGTSAPAVGSIQSLLFNNSIALQYDVSYYEYGTGMWNGGDEMIRAANTLNFGLAYFNQWTGSREFYGNTGTTVNQGYILPSIDNPVLGSPFTGNTYYNTHYSAGSETGTQWWQPYGGSVSNGYIMYPTSPVYFMLYNNDTVRDPFNPFPLGESVAFSINYSGIGINKIIGPNTLSGDSSASNNDSSIALENQGTYYFPTLSQLSSGASMPSFTYDYSGELMTAGSSGNPSQCFAGVYLPDVNTGNSTIANGYGWPQAAYNYLCGNGTTTAWLSLGPNSSNAYTVDNIEQYASMSFSPISNFFGF